jgi:hypothetical protein
MLILLLTVLLPALCFGGGIDVNLRFDDNAPQILFVVLNFSNLERIQKSNFLSFGMLELLANDWT